MCFNPAQGRATAFNTFLMACGSQIVVSKCLPVVHHVLISKMMSHYFIKFWQEYIFLSETKMR